MSDTKAFGERVLRGMKRAVREAIEEHHRAGHPVVIWRDGQIVRWYPDGTYQPVKSAAETEEASLTTADAPD